MHSDIDIPAYPVPIYYKPCVLETLSATVPTRHINHPEDEDAAYIAYIAMSGHSPLMPLQRSEGYVSANKLLTTPRGWAVAP